MGVIRKQTITGTIYTYLGVGIGFLTGAILAPKILTTDEIGLFGILISYSLIFAQFSSFGFNSVTTRLFSYFRNDKKAHNGFLFIAVSVSIIGLILAIIVILLFESSLIERKIESSPLFVENYFCLIPLVAFTLFFNLFDNYYKVLFNATRGIFLKEFVQRIFLLASILLYHFQILLFEQFVFAYISALCLPAVFITLSLIREGQFNLRPQRGFVSRKLAKIMFNVSIYGVISGFAGMVILNIDKIMIESILDLSATGIYTTTFFFAQLISMPSRSLLKISSAIIAEAWKKRDILTIKSIYYKSSLNLFIIGILLFIGIWGNINNVFQILPVQYEAGKYVILFIGLAFLFDMASGASAQILASSRYYRVQTIFMTILVFVVITSNYLLIPQYGITGAALASALSKLMYNLMRYIFLLVKFKMQIYNSKFLIVLIIASLSYFAGYVIPEFSNYILDIIVRSAVISVIFGGLILMTKVSEDINEGFNSIRKKIFG